MLPFIWQSGPTLSLLLSTFSCSILKLTLDKINSFQEKHLKIAYFGGYESRLRDFRRPWAPNGWHQVNFRPAPEHLGVWRFKLATWEVGASKWSAHEPATFFSVGTRKLGKKCFFGKTLHTRKFSMANFFGANTQGVLTYSGFRRYSQFGWPSLRFEVTAAQKWGHRKNWAGFQK